MHERRPARTRPDAYSLMSKCHHANNAVRRAMRSAEEAEILRLCALLAGAMPGEFRMALEADPIRPVLI